MESQEDNQQPHLILAHKHFLLTQPDVPDIEKVRLREEVVASLKADDMSQFYQTLAFESMLDMDQEVLNSMRGRIDEEPKKLDEKAIYP